MTKQFVAKLVAKFILQILGPATLCGALAGFDIIAWSSAAFIVATLAYVLGHPGTHAFLRVYSESRRIVQLQQSTLQAAYDTGRPIVGSGYTTTDDEPPSGSP